MRNFLSIYQMLRFVKLGAEIRVFHGCLINKVYLPAKQPLKGMVEVNKIVCIRIMVNIRIEVHQYIHIALGIEPLGKH